MGADTQASGPSGEPAESQRPMIRVNCLFSIMVQRNNTLDRHATCVGSKRYDASRRNKDVRNAPSPRQNATSLLSPRNESPEGLLGTSEALKIIGVANITAVTSTLLSWRRDFRTWRTSCRRLFNGPNPPRAKLHQQKIPWTLHRVRTQANNHRQTWLLRVPRKG